MPAKKKTTVLREDPAPYGAEANEGGEMVLYHSPDGKVHFDVRMAGETFWMTQQQMAELFQTTKQNIGQHISKITKSAELQEEGTVKYFFTVRFEGSREVTRPIAFYNLDMIIAVGYRVNSIRGTQFRIWATQTLKEYIAKGFVLDDERLKNPPIDGASSVPDHFDDLFERIRDIRSSERRMYLRMREIFAMAADYIPSSKQAVDFYSKMQNRLHYAITGHTAAELIKERADSLQSNMGLTSWKGGIVRKSDVRIAKNYLREIEIGDFNRLTSLCLDFVEDQAKSRRDVFLADWEAKLNELLKLMGKKLLKGAGRVTRQYAEEHAAQQFDEFAKRRRAYAEEQGEIDYMKALEQHLPQNS